MNSPNTIPGQGKLTEKFVEYATAHRVLFIEGDIKGSNRAHDRLIKIAIKFRQLPDRGEHLLRELIQSDHENVRKWAAYFLLPIDEKAAVDALQNISTTTESASIKNSADITIEEWRKGRLDVDWFLKK